MTGHIVYTPAETHNCQLPSVLGEIANPARPILVGSQWQCDDCHQLWKLNPGGWRRNGNPGKRVEATGEYHVHPDLTMPDPTLSTRDWVPFCWLCMIIGLTVVILGVWGTGLLLRWWVL